MENAVPGEVAGEKVLAVGLEARQAPASGFGHQGEDGVGFAAGAGQAGNGQGGCVRHLGVSYQSDVLGRLFESGLGNFQPNFTGFIHVGRGGRSMVREAWVVHVKHRVGQDGEFAFRGRALRRALELGQQRRRRRNVDEVVAFDEQASGVARVGQGRKGDVVQTFVCNDHQALAGEVMGKWGEDELRQGFAVGGGVMGGLLTCLPEQAGGRIDRVAGEEFKTGQAVRGQHPGVAVELAQVIDQKHRVGVEEPLLEFGSGGRGGLGQSGVVGVARANFPAGTVKFL